MTFKEYGMYESYGSFAYVYDKFMDNVPYSEWTDYIVSLLSRENIREGIAVDLGCGTGAVTELLALKGFDMIGIDLSEDMLCVAADRRAGFAAKHPEAKDILYLCQDMTEFELYGTAAAIVSVCDSMNYILEDDDLLKVFKLVRNYLDYDGVFVFDMNTPYKYSEILADNVFAENRDDCSFIWENTYDPDTRINEYDLTLYVSDGTDDRYSRYEELHRQRAYDIDDVKKLLDMSGLKLLHVYDAFTYDEPKADSERVYFIAVKRPAAANEKE